MHPDSLPFFPAIPCLFPQGYRRIKTLLVAETRSPSRETNNKSIKCSTTGGTKTRHSDRPGSFPFLSGLDFLGESPGFRCHPKLGSRSCQHGQHPVAAGSPACLPSLAFSRTVLATIFSSSMFSWVVGSLRPSLVAGLAVNMSFPHPPKRNILTPNDSSSCRSSLGLRPGAPCLSPCVYLSTPPTLQTIGANMKFTRHVLLLLLDGSLAATPQIMPYMARFDLVVRILEILNVKMITMAISRYNWTGDRAKERKKEM